MKNFLMLLSAIALLAGCQNNAANLQSKIDSLEAELKKYKDNEAEIKTRLAAFDTLDYDYYSNQRWDKFGESHADNILVYYPDGTTTTGLAPQHIDMLTPMFVFAPDTKIKQHPVAFGTGEWTCAIGVMEGTFSQPMPIGGGKTIAPTGKTFKLRMCTIGRWKDGKMSEEHLFWDNQAFMKQIGLAN